MRSFTLFITVFFLKFLIISSNDVIAQDWWPMFQHDLSNTGYSTSTAPNTNEILWSYTTDGHIESPPAIVDGRVYVGSGDLKVYCLDASNGDSIWSRSIGHFVYTCPAVANGKIYIGSFNDKVYCLDALNGDSIWCYTTGGDIWSSLAVADGKVYVGSLDDKIYCLNAETGDSIWCYTTGDNISSSPAVADGKVYVGSRDNNIYCLNALNGDSIWSYTTGDGIVHSSPAVYNGKVYIGSTDNNIYCLDASNGDSIWCYTTGYIIYSSPAVADGKVYVGSWDNKIYCLDSGNGDSIWCYTTGDNISSSPAVADGKVYVGSEDSTVYCLDASNGDFIWSYATGKLINHSSPAVADGKVCIGSTDGNVYCFGTPQTIHDVAVTNVVPSDAVVYQGDTTSIDVTVENQGDSSETFNVTAYYYDGNIPNGDFEADSANTSFNDISNWSCTTIVHGGNPPTGESLYIADDYYFTGDKSLYSYLHTTSLPPSPGDSRVSQLLSTESPISTTADYISLWIAGDGYTTSDRYTWHIALILTDGDSTYEEKLRCDSWGNNEGCTPNHFDYYDAIEIGDDGRTWKRYTREIPDNIDKSNLTVEIRHYQQSWDQTQASSWYRLDQICVSDSLGNSHGFIEMRTAADLSPGQDTTMTFTWNTAGVEPGDHTISAHAHPVPGETDTEDNTYVDGTVTIAPVPIPTLSEWGMLILGLLLLAVGTIAIIRKRKTVVQRQIR